MTVALCVPQHVVAEDNFHILNPSAFSHYVERFNSMEDENVTNFVSNANSWNWLQKEIPFFECPDREVEEMYYFRWWSFRKHLERTTNGFVFTEFLTRATPVSSAVGHQIAEGRWLRHQNYLDDYVHYWLRDQNSRLQLHKYSNWLEDALYQRCLVTGDRKFVISLLDDLARDYRQWEQERLSTNGLFCQYDVRDAMEESISGSRTNKNLRPTINSYMFANARAIGAIARLAGKETVANEFEARAVRLKKLVLQQLWNSEAGFFEVLRDNGKFSNAREEIGFIPWMLELPDHDVKYAAVWTQLKDPQGFSAPYGITTAERRHPQFRTHGYGHCEWDGAVWPFATSQTLVALANYLRDYGGISLSPSGGEGRGEGAGRPIIALAATKDVQDAILADEKRAAVVDVICFRYWWRTDKGLFAPKGGQNLSPRQLERPWKGGPPSDENLAAMAAEYRRRFSDKGVIAAGEDVPINRGAWAFVCAGGSMPNLPATTDAKLLAAIPRMKPWVADSGKKLWALREAGKNYLVCSGAGGEAQIDLNDERGKFDVNTVSENGTVTSAGEPIESGRVVTLKKANGRMVFWLTKD